MDAREGKGRVLMGSMDFVRVARRHEERRVDFETPGTSLNGTGSGKFGKVAR